MKKMQLMELAILNGTYRDNKFIVPMTMAAARKCQPDYRRVTLISVFS